MFFELRKLTDEESRSNARRLSTDKSDCPTGVYLGCECQNDIGVFALTGVKSLAYVLHYYTTWSLLLIIIATIVAVVVRFRIAGLDKFAKKWNKAWLVLYSFMLFSVINTFTVMIVAGVILGRQEGLDNPSNCPYTMEIETLTGKLLSDMFIHNAPVLLAFITLAVINRDIPRPVKSRWKLFGAMVFVFPGSYSGLPFGPSRR